MATIEIPTLANELVRLEPLNMDHLYQHFEWNNDPELNRLDSEVPYEEEALPDFKRRFEEFVFNPRPDIVDLEVHTTEGKLIGVIYIVGINRHNGNALIGVTIGDRDYWGRGYGRAALQLVLRYCFEHLELHRVTAETFEYNPAWKKLVVWAGFQREGTLRQHLFRDGEYWDKGLFGILRSEFTPKPIVELDPQA
jgi:RimJ/RimL family protein N-acetyltransferase